MSVLHAENLLMTEVSGRERGGRQLRAVNSQHAYEASPPRPLRLLAPRSCPPRSTEHDREHDSQCTHVRGADECVANARSVRLPQVCPSAAA
jgi:hypothetical protein